MELLKLVALDQEDLTVISTYLQDAIVNVGDIAYLPSEHRFAIAAKRFAWEEGSDTPPQRRLVGMHFERVKAVRTRGIDPHNKDAVLNLLAIAFEEGDQPSGTATLMFSDGAAIQVDVECIEMQMKDLGPVWAAESRPTHDDVPVERS